MDPNESTPAAPHDDSAPVQDQAGAEGQLRYPAPSVPRGRAVPTAAPPQYPSQGQAQYPVQGQAPTQPPPSQQQVHQAPTSTPKPVAPKTVTKPRAAAEPGAKPELTEAEIAQEKQTRGLVLRFALLLLATVLASSLPLPGLVVAVPLIVWVVWTGISLLRRPKRPGASTWTTFTVVGFGVTAIISLGVLTSIATWNARIDYQTCMDRALTSSAQMQCQAEYTDRVTGSFGSVANFG